MVQKTRTNLTIKRIEMPGEKQYIYDYMKKKTKNVIVKNEPSGLNFIQYTVSITSITNIVQHSFTSQVCCNAVPVHQT